VHYSHLLIGHQFADPTLGKPGGRSYLRLSRTLVLSQQTECHSEIPGPQSLPKVPPVQQHGTEHGA
jgi:hypothetical protein